MLRRLSTQLVLVGAIVATIGCDRVTKHVATTSLAGEPGRSYLADTIRLEYVENQGGFLSLGADLPRAVRTALFIFGSGLILAGGFINIGVGPLRTGIFNVADVAVMLGAAVLLLGERMNITKRG